MRSLLDYWHDFEAARLPPEAPEYQRNDMRYAFYAGVACTMVVMRGIGEECGGNAHAERRLMGQLYDECMNYLRKWGKATSTELH